MTYNATGDMMPGLKVIVSKRGRSCAACSGNSNNLFAHTFIAQLQSAHMAGFKASLPILSLSKLYYERITKISQLFMRF